MLPKIMAAALAALALSIGPANAYPVGERHLTTTSATAPLRDAQHRPTLRITVWYPAAPDTKESPLDIGAPGQPIFQEGAAANEAPFADGRARAVILLSHGYGGTARVMGWFGTELARAGYVVVAVDHPGNNGQDQMTTPGAAMFWDRPGDLRDALAAAESDPTIGPHLDRSRVGVSGFSAGGFTALAAAGAKVDLERFIAFCTANPSDGVCKPQKEFPLTLTQAEQALSAPELAAERARADGVHAVPGVRAVFVMAPAIVQAFDPESLKAMQAPVAIILGEADPIATPATNGLAAARLIPHAELVRLPGVAHYDFLAICTPAGEARVDICRTAVPKAPTHRAAVTDALAFYRRTLGGP